MDQKYLFTIDLDSVHTETKKVESVLKELTFQLERKIRQGNNANW